MANTYVDYTAVASQTDYNFSFEYLRDEHVKVKVDDIIVTNYTIVTSPVQLIRFDTAPTASAAIKIYRDSRGDFSPLVDFVDGSVLTENELDEAYRHNLFVSQEASEGTGNELLNKKGGANYDAEGNKIINLGTPTTGTDAANKGYVDQTIDNSISLGGSPAIVSLGGYDVTALGTSITRSLADWTNDLATGDLEVTATGSTTARSLADRFADAVNVKDFGAVADANYLDGGVWYVDAGLTTPATDSTAAFQAAVATGRDVIIPSANKLRATPNTLAGNYLISGSIGELQEYQTFKAEGWVSIKVNNTGSDFTVLTCRSNTIVENIWFDGFTSSQGTCLKFSGIGYTADGYSGSLQVKNCWLRGFNKGYVADNSFDAIFYDVELRQCGYGAYLVSDYIATHYFNGCRFIGNGTHDVYLELTANSANRVVTFEACTFDPMASATNSSCRLINAALVNWNNCYFEASTDGTNKQIEATDSINLSVNNCILTKTGGISLDTSQMQIKNVWSFGFETDTADHDPIVATNSSRVVIEDSAMRGTGHDFINGTLYYKIVNSTVTLGGVARFYRHKVGGSNTNELLELHDSSDNKIVEIDQDSLNIISGNLELTGNNKIYTGTGGEVSAGGALTFRLSAVDDDIRSVMIKVFLQGRDTSNNAVTNQASCEYVFTAVNVVGGVCQVSPVTTVHEYVFSAASHFSVTLNPSSLNDTIDVVLTNPVSGQTLNNTFYKVELLGSPWDLDSVTAS